VVEQTLNQFRDEIALRVILDKRIQKDGIGTTVGAEQQIGLIGVLSGEVGSSGGLDDMIIDVLTNLLQRRFILDHLPEPANRLHGQIFETGFIEKAKRLRRIRIIPLRPHVKGIGA